MLALALTAAGAMAALGQWQLERSFEGGEIEGVATEEVVALTDFIEPFQPINDFMIGQLVTVDASFVPEDFVVFEGRSNHGDPGFTVVGHGIVEGTGATLAVALGWAPTLDEANAAADELADDAGDVLGIAGRFLPSEAPVQSNFEDGIRSAIAVPELINIWSTVPVGVYGGYVIADDAPAGLEVIDAPAPSIETSLNLLNLFYALEWVIFGGFAIYLWWRLVKDVVEVEAEQAADAAATASGDRVTKTSAAATRK